MRLWLGALALVAVVLGGAWLAVSLTFGHLHGGQTAYARSMRCLNAEPALTADPGDAARYRGPGLHTLGLRWNRVRAVALFADSLSPDAVDLVDARIVAGLHRSGLSAAQIESRLLHEDNLSLYYLTGPPTTAAQAEIGRCVFLVHYNRVASAVGIYINPHARRPFLPGARRDG